MTAAGFDEQWAATAVTQLRDRGVEFASGMTDSDLAAIEARFGCPMPAELSMLLRAGVPVSPKWARWTEGADVVAAESREWLRGTFAFDIEHNGYVFLTAEQVESLATTIDQRYSTLIHLAAYTGLRAGEICALRVRRVDLVKGRITVAESVTELQGRGLHFSEPKTYERRSVTLPAFLVEKLTTHMKGRPDEPDAFVFSSPEGSTLNHKGTSTADTSSPPSPQPASQPR